MVMQMSGAKERFKPHFSYLDELDAAIDDALTRFPGAKEEDLKELKTLKDEVEQARGALSDVCVRFPAT